MDSLDRFQALLRDLFQLDTADLDFGIYRLYHIRRDEIEAFITKQIPETVAATFGQADESERVEIQRQVEEAARAIRDEVGGESFELDGRVREAIKQAPGRTLHDAIARYDMALSRLGQAEGIEAQQIDVFNHLYAFFSRYYEDGDFIPKRRYGASETYAVPYEGEEVYLHWANRGQHYVKSAEYLRDYAFAVDALGGPYHVRFSLADATLPTDNTKGDTRYFYPRVSDVVYEAKALTIPFVYRLPTPEELEHHGANAKGQESILRESLDVMLGAVTDDALALALKATVKIIDKEEISLLLHRLRHFVRKQTSDYFVHKDLAGFLTRELEFYIKDQVLQLADLDGDLMRKLRMISAFRHVAEDIITFLDQLERVQCRLFEKKKFVLSTEYLCTLQTVPEELWPTVLENHAQHEEWRELFALEDSPDEGFLHDHPTLAISTRHFDSHFQNELLSSFDNIDDSIDGLLIRAENYQALSLLQQTHHSRVSCVHIDPPYNTDTSGFLYKNAYRHSSWLAMMQERILASIGLLERDGYFMCHIDENEYERLHLLLEYSHLPDAGTIVWDKRNPMNAGRGVANEHEYIVCRTQQTTPIYLRNENVAWILEAARQAVSIHRGVTDAARQQFSAAVSANKALSGGEKAYRLLDEEGRPYQSVSLRAPEPRSDPKFHQPLLHPVTGKPCPVPPNGFSRTPDTLAEMMERGEILFGADEKTQPRQKVLLTEETKRQIPSVIQNAYKGKADLDPLGLDFPYCHPVSLYDTLVGATTRADSASVVLDYFAGSATTAHAVIDLNRLDGGDRRFVLVEMAEYFNSVLLPRIQKVMYCPNWKKGKPVGYPEADILGEWPEWVERTPRLVKVIRLEGYEDALHNLVTEETLERERERSAAYKEALGEREYRLRYLAKLPLEASTTMLAVDKLEHPFAYTLEVLTDHGPEERTVDLVETFNFLYGLRVRRIRSIENDLDQRSYRLVAGDRRNGETVLVIWRDTEGLAPELERAFLEPHIQGYDRVLINADCAIPGVDSLDPLFKRLMETTEG